MGSGEEASCRSRKIVSKVADNGCITDLWPKLDSIFRMGDAKLVVFVQHTDTAPLKTLSPVHALLIIKNTFPPDYTI